MKQLKFRDHFKFPCLDEKKNGTTTTTHNELKDKQSTATYFI